MPLYYSLCQIKLLISQNSKRFKIFKLMSTNDIFLSHESINRRFPTQRCSEIVSTKRRITTFYNVL